MDDKDEIQQQVVNLAKACQKRENLYNRFAQNTPEPNLVAIFNQYEYQSRQFFKELTTYISEDLSFHALDKNITDVVKDGIEEISALFRSGSNSYVISHCIEQDRNLLHEYRSIIKKDIPQNLKTLFSSQSQEVEKAIKRLENLPID